MHPSSRSRVLASVAIRLSSIARIALLIRSQSAVVGVMIEHINLRVGNSVRTAALLEAIFGWHIRWQDPAQSGGWTVHVGNGRDYVALWSAGCDTGQHLSHAKGAPLNHLGNLVDDLAGVEHRVIASGLTPFGHDDYDPGRRFYFFDPDGIEHAIVSHSQTTAPPD